jgi:hypothetical protein
MEVVLLTVFGTILSCILLAGIAYGGVWVYRNKREQLATLRQFSESVSRLGDIAKALEDLPKLIGGHANAAAAMAIEVAKLRESVQSFSKLVMKPEEPSSVTYPKEEDASKFWTIQQIIAEHPEMDLQRAGELAEEEMEKRDGLPQMGLE